MIAVLRTHPLNNLISFLVHYEVVSGPFVGHPPLSLLLMSVGYEVLPSIIGPRIVSVLLATASVGVMYYLVRDLSQSRELALFCTAIYGFVPHTALFLSLALTNTAALFFGITSIWLFVRSLRKPSLQLALLAGISFGLALWSRMWEPFFWTFIALIVVLFTSSRRRFPVNLGLFGLMTIIGLAIYGIWALINPSSFSQSSPLTLVRYLLRLPNPSSWQTGTENVGVTSATTMAITSITGSRTTTITTTTQAVVRGWLGLLSPYSITGASSVSFSDVIAQLPLWITPMVILLCVGGIVLAFRRRSRLGVVETLWAIVPLLLMLPYFRDVRYLLVAAPAYSFLAAMSVGFIRSRKSRLRLQAVILGSVFIFLMLVLPVSQQLYGGVSDASYQLQRLGLTDAVIMTNGPLDFYLPHIRIVFLDPAYTPVNIGDALQLNHVRVVVVFYNSRGAWPYISPAVVQVIRENFNGYIWGGSAFSWYEIYYHQ